MSVALGLLVLFILLDLVAFVGWAPTSREPRDWDVAGSPFEAPCSLIRGAASR